MTSLATKHTQREGVPQLAELPSADLTELERLAAENRLLRRQLFHTQRLATVGTMTAMIIHEFNNILTPIINYAQLAADGDPEMTRKAVAKAAEGGQRASDICVALLGMLRSEAAEPTKVNLAQLVKDSLLAMGRNLAKDGIVAQISVPASLEAVTRPAELKQVLVNLVLNARSAVLKKGRGGSITISAARKGRRIHLAVADGGTGIDPEHLPHIFQPFFTTKTDPGGEKGTGLGLAVCKEVVEALGGEIRVDSILGQGATFTCVLPA